MSVAFPVEKNSGMGGGIGFWTRASGRSEAVRGGEFDDLPQ
jgi:hypothetical protein